MTKFLALALAAMAVALADCAQYEARQRAEAQAEAAAIAANDDAKCQSYGVQPGSPAYVQCRMNLDNLHAQDLQNRRAIAAQYLLSRSQSQVPQYDPSAAVRAQEQYKITPIQ
jgi:hypothetical protein